MLDPFVWKVGSVLSLRVTQLGSAGKALGRSQNKVVFVEDGVPGDDVRVRLTKVKTQWAEGVIEHILEPSESRLMVPKCLVASQCGSCQWQSVAYSMQLEAKQSQVLQAIRRIGGLEDVLVEDVLPSAQFHYRNRVTFPFSTSSRDSTQMGYYKKGSHDVVDIDSCPVQDKRLDDLLKNIKDDILAQGWPIYNEKTGSGGVHHLSMRIGHYTGEILVTVVATEFGLPRIQEIAENWIKTHPAVAGVCVNQKIRKDKSVFGQKTKTVAGRGSIREEFLGISLMLSSTTFFQVNTIQAEKLVSVLINELDLNGCETIYDAYCGVGTLSLPLAKKVPKGTVWGFEISKESIEQANNNARRNDVDNTNFLVGKVEVVLPKQLAREQAPPDVIVLDPPRQGCKESVLAAILQCRPRQIAYMSCNSATLARDLSVLCGKGGLYTVRKVQPADFFPQTFHVEAVAILDQIRPR